MSDTLSQYQAEANPADWATATNLADKYGIPPNVFQALIAHESSWNPNAASATSTSVGYGQLTAGTASYLGVNPFIPSQNLEGAAKYLSQMYKKFGNWTDALAHYNQGPNASSASDLAAGAKYASSVLSLANTSAGAQGTSAGSAASPPADLSSVGGVLAWIKSQLGNLAFLMIGAALLIIAILASEKGQEVVSAAVKTAAVA